jgi:general secretion pathway protein E
MQQPMPNSPVPNNPVLELSRLNSGEPQYATKVIDRILSLAQESGAGDVHLQPGAEGLEVHFRVDGVLRRMAVFSTKSAAGIIARLKVLSGLLTYHTDRPQEGRIQQTDCDVEMRVSTFPTLHGERAVVRLFGSGGRFERLDELGLHDDLRSAIEKLLAETSGAVIVSGPAGAGKTTTVYAALRELARRDETPRSIVSLEDPIEVAVPGVSQSQVNTSVNLDLATGLRFLMRQDPEVIMVGEIRDSATAEAAMQASLTGHLLLTTFHAGSSTETISRLLDMGIEPYVLCSGLLAVINQRLLRRLCNCAQAATVDADLLGLPVAKASLPVGCDACGGSGYGGRLLLAELLLPRRDELRAAILDRRDTNRLQHLAQQSGMVTIWQRAFQAVESGSTSPAEVRRVLGFSKAASASDSSGGANV